jgi:hypothetical protein
MAADLQVVPGRSCAGCTICCTLLSIDELDKPSGQDCAHCDIGIGCTIYAARPTSCSGFYCGYLLNASLGEEWRPLDCGIVLSYDSGTNRIIVSVEAARGELWKQQPYYAMLESWATRILPVQGLVLVLQGRDTIAILPDREINLGTILPGQMIVTAETHSPHGATTYDVIVMEPDDPRLAT